MREIKNANTPSLRGAFPLSLRGAKKIPSLLSEQAVAISTTTVSLRGAKRRGNLNLFNF